jgi:hypothetical protein
MVMELVDCIKLVSRLLLLGLDLGSLVRSDNSDKSDKLDYQGMNFGQGSELK